MKKLWRNAPRACGREDSKVLEIYFYYFDNLHSFYCLGKLIGDRQGDKSKAGHLSGTILDDQLEKLQTNLYIYCH